MRLLSFILFFLVSTPGYSQLKDSLLFSTNGEFVLVYDYDVSVRRNVDLWNVYSSSSSEPELSFLKENELYFQIDYSTLVDSFLIERLELLNVKKVLEIYDLKVKGREVSEDVRVKLASKSNFTENSEVLPENQFDITISFLHDEVLIGDAVFENFMATNQEFEIRIRPTANYDEETNELRGYMPANLFVMMSDSGNFFIHARILLNRAGSRMPPPELETGEFAYWDISASVCREECILLLK